VTVIEPSDQVLSEARRVALEVAWPIMRDTPAENSWVWSETATCLVDPIIQACSR
jgi:hypothetical protein